MHIDQLVPFLRAMVDPEGKGVSPEEEELLAELEERIEAYKGSGVQRSAASIEQAVDAAITEVRRSLPDGGDLAGEGFWDAVRDTVFSVFAPEYDVEIRDTLIASAPGGGVKIHGSLLLQGATLLMSTPLRYGFFSRPRLHRLRPYAEDLKTLRVMWRWLREMRERA